MSVFDFDDVDLGLLSHSRRSSVSSVHDAASGLGQAGPVMDEFRPSLPIAIKHPNGQFGRAPDFYDHGLLAEVPEMEEEDDDEAEPTALTDANAMHMKNNSVRLGQSYEVGIDRQYVSSDSGMSKTTAKKMTPQDFEPLKVLGEGAYGRVFLVRHRPTGKLFAQKQLKKASMVVEKKKIEQTKNERSILESVRHPYIVRLFYALQDAHKLYLILEYAQGGELFTHLAMERMLSEEVTAFYLAEMALALYHLHVNVGVVYRDLKPENCLLDAEGHLVLTDFGLSKVADDESCRTVLGTPEYMAPEVLMGKEYDYAVDWWSLGAVCYDLLTGNPPFRGANHNKIIERISKSKLNLPYYLSADAKDLLVKLLKKQPEKRLGHRDFDKIKSHRFFRKIDWAKLEVRHRDLVPPIVPVITDPELAENFSASFTDMPITPEDRGEFGAVAVPIATTGSGANRLRSNSVDTTFMGFSFQASTSFINSSQGRFRE